MAIVLDMRSGDFERRFKALLDGKREQAADVDAAVADIIEDVRERGDEALADYSLRFDRVNIKAKGIAIGPAEIEAAIAASEPKALGALELAHERVMDYHRRQRPADMRFTDAVGVELGWRWRLIEAVGLYVPGGAASYPSSVVMNAVPAKVAGFAAFAMVSPTPDGRDQSARPGGGAHRRRRRDLSRRRRPGDRRAGLRDGDDRGGQQDRGPGNAFVAAAKRRVFGVVGIDMIAGPSEVVILANSSADPRFVAADLLAQAEHDPAAQSILIADDAQLARSRPRSTISSVAAARRDRGRELARLRRRHPLPKPRRSAAARRPACARTPRDHGARCRCARRRGQERRRDLPRRRSPEAIGDFVGGSNHVLPTGRSARFSSGLGVIDFMKRTSLLKCDPGSLAVLGPYAIALGEAEGLAAHARSVAMRLDVAPASVGPP